MQIVFSLDYHIYYKKIRNIRKSKKKKSIKKKIFEKTEKKRRIL